MNRESIEKITSELTETLLKKNEMYGGASFDLGVTGNMVHIWDKARRYRTLVERNKSNNTEVHFEGVRDTLLDLMGYCIIGLHILEQDGEA